MKWKATYYDGKEFLQDDMPYAALDRDALHSIQLLREDGCEIAEVIGTITMQPIYRRRTFLHEAADEESEDVAEVFHLLGLTDGPTQHGMILNEAGELLYRGQLVQGEVYGYPVVLLPEEQLAL